MASKTKKAKIAGFATLVDEREFMAWGEVPEWTPVRPVVKAVKLFGKKCDYFAKLPDALLCGDMNRLFFVLFDTDNDKYAKNQTVPFYRTKAIVALDTQCEALYRSRYGETLSVSLAADAVRDDLQSRVKGWKRNVELLNIHNGSAKLLEMCGLNRPETLPCDEGAVDAFCCGDVEALAAVNADIRALLGYTRHAPNFPETLLGAVCDVGAILRSLAKDDGDNERLKLLGAFVNSIKGEAMPFSFGQLGRLNEIGLELPLLKVPFIVYLFWKYQAEQKDGEIDFRKLMSGVDELRTTDLKESDWSGAVWLLGAMAGFKSFSSYYHDFKREQLRKSTPEPVKREPPVVEIKIESEVKPVVQGTN